jgi:methylglutaconyl-CoA hydratase
LSGDPLVLLDAAGPVARVTLNRPEKRNALDANLIRALGDALRRADSAPSTRVILLRGAGKDFCAGADLASIHRMADSPALEILADVELLADLFLSMRRLRNPIVAVVHGRALAGGSGLATACDVVLASRSATFGYPEVRIGFVPAMVMAILRRNVSEKRAFELITLGEPITATDAERFGMINQVHPDDELDDAAEAFASKLAGRSASAVQLCKRLLYQQDALGFEAAVRAGVDVNVIARMTEDTRAGIASFVEGDRR